MGKLYKKGVKINMNKLEDINYALMAQLVYLKWNNLEDKKEVEGKFLEDILFKDIIIFSIKTDFYNDPKHYPSNEKVQIKEFDETTDGTRFENFRSEMSKKLNEAFLRYGELPPYTYHEEDKRLFLVYSLDETEKRTPFFENIINGWEYLDCATGTDIQKIFFGEPITIERGFFGAAFQRGNDIMIAYRGTEFNLLEPEKDLKTDANIYLKETDIQQVEAVLFYEYIKTKYGAGKNIHITGHSLAGALAQYVHFYAYCQGDSVFTVTWNGLGAYESIIISPKFSLTEELPKSSNISNDVSTLNLKIMKAEQEDFRKAISSINKIEYPSSKDRIEKFYSSSKEEIITNRNRAEKLTSIVNYYMDEDFVSGRINTRGLGEKILVNVKEKTLNDRDIVSLSTGDLMVDKKLKASVSFHNVNNFLVFMGDSGNIMPNVIRPEFRKNALKSIVKDKVTAYSSLKVKNKEYELWKKADEEVNLYSDILSPTNRLIKPNGRIVSSTAVRQKDILFVESFEQNDFKSYDMEVKDVSGEEHIKEIKLGEYNNLEKLGGIVGGEELIIKVYKEKKKEVEEKKIAQINQKANNFTRTRFERV